MDVLPLPKLSTRTVVYLELFLLLVLVFPYHLTVIVCLPLCVLSFEVVVHKGCRIIYGIYLSKGVR